MLLSIFKDSNQSYISSTCTRNSINSIKFINIIIELIINVIQTELNRHFNSSLQLPKYILHPSLSISYSQFNIEYIIRNSQCVTFTLVTKLQPSGTP